MEPERATRAAFRSESGTFSIHTLEEELEFIRD